MTSSAVIAYAVDLVYLYVELYLSPPTKDMPKNDFKRRCYKRCAAEEIVRLFLDNPFESPYLTLERFIVEMGIAADNSLANYELFDCAREVACDIMSTI